MDGEKLWTKRHVEFCSSFNSGSFAVDFRVFKNFNRIVKNVQTLGKTNSAGKTELFQFFSLENWKTLTREEKDKHSLFDCIGCTENWVCKSKLAVFKNFSLPFKRKAAEHHFPQAANAVKTALEYAEKGEKDFYGIYNQSLKNVLQTSWGMEATSPVKSQTPSDKKKERDAIGRQFKNELESILAENVVERLVDFFFSLRFV